MAYINRDELDLAIQEIRQFCSSYQSKLNDVINQTVEVSNANASFETFDGCSISGTLKETDEVTSSGVNKKVVDKIIISPSNINEYCNLISQEKEEMDEKITNIVQSLDSMQSSLEVIAIYLLQVESALDDGTPVSLCDRLKEASQLMTVDRMFGYSFLNSMPVLENGRIDFWNGSGTTGDPVEYDGKYLKFFNEYGVKFYAPMAIIGDGVITPYSNDEIDEYSQYYSRCYVNIMKMQNVFTDLHKQSIRENLDMVILENSDYERNNGAITFPWGPEDGKTCSVNINIHNMLENPIPNHEYDSSVVTFTHESGHVLDNYLAKKSGCAYGFSNRPEYQDYYNSLLTNSFAHSEYHALGYYAFDNSAENFAESITEYYGNFYSNDFKRYSPYDLQDIEVCPNPLPGWITKIEHSVTAYDVFDNILKNGDMNGIDFSN